MPGINLIDCNTTIAQSLAFRCDTKIFIILDIHSQRPVHILLLLCVPDLLITVPPDARAISQAI